MSRLRQQVFMTSLTALIFLLVFAAPSQADMGQMGNKLRRGLVNVATGWFEIFHQPHQVGQQEGYAAGATKGLLLGIGWAAARTVVGVWDVGTFLFPIPPNYESILEPETLI